MCCLVVQSNGIRLWEGNGFDKALVTRSEALVSNSFLLLLVRHLLLLARHLFLLVYC